MNHMQFFDELKKGTVRNVYFFYGEEAFIRKSALDRLAAKVLSPGLEDMNRTVLFAPSVQQIIESSETLPLMSDYRLVVVRDCALLGKGREKAGDKPEAQDDAARGDTAQLLEYIARTPETTCLVFEAGGEIDKRKKLTAALLKLPGAVSFDKLGDSELAQWMNQRLRPMGKHMSRDACDALAFSSGRDLTQLSGELAKLAAYADGRGEITPEDVERIATKTSESTVFAMVDAIADGKPAEAFDRLGTLLQSGEKRIGILALITRHYRQLMYLRAMLDSGMQQTQLAQALGVPPFALGRLRRQLGKKNLAALSADLERCVQADYDIKRGAMDEEAALERVMLTLMGAGC